MHYIIHAYSDGRTEWGEELKEIPKVFLVQYWPWGDDHCPQPMVIARYELVSVVEGELPRKSHDKLTEKIAAEIEKKFFNVRRREKDTDEKTNQG